MSNIQYWLTITLIASPVIVWMISRLSNFIKDRMMMKVSKQEQLAVRRKLAEMNLVIGSLLLNIMFDIAKIKKEVHKQNELLLECKLKARYLLKVQKIINSIGKVGA